MDGHHEIVMKARAAAEAAGTPPRHYFAYSTILDRAALTEWQTQHGYASFTLPAGDLAVAQDLALIYDFPSRWWGGRVAGLVDRPGSVVHGRLFTISGADWPIVQHKEGAITAMSVERPVRVRTAAGDVDAIAFTTAPNRARTDGPVSDRFVEALIRGARAAGLPEDYVNSLTASAV